MGRNLKRPERRQHVTPMDRARGAVSNVWLFIAWGVDRESVLQRLGHLPADGLAVADFTIEGVSDALGKAVDPVIIVPEAVQAIARAISQGEYPSVALGRWHEVITEILTLRRGDRRRILLISEDYLLSHVESGGHSAADRLLLKDAVPVETPVIDAFSLCLAHLAFRISPEVNETAVELEASSLSDGNVSLGFKEIDSVFDATRKINAETKDLEDRLELADKTASAQESALNKERDLHVAHLAQLQSEIETLTGQKTLLHDQIAITDKQSTAHKKSLSAALAKAEATLEAEKETLTKTRAEMREFGKTLAKTRAENARLADDIATRTNREVGLGKAGELSRAHLAQLQSEIEILAGQDMLLRDQIAMADRQDTVQQKALKSNQAELEKTRKRLTLVETQHARIREEMSVVEGRAMTQFNQIKRLDRELRQSKAHTAETEALVQQFQVREKQLCEQVSGLEIEYSKVLLSRSWRATEPLRTANRVLGARPERKK